MSRPPFFDHRLLAQRHPIEFGRFRTFLARSGGKGLLLKVDIEHEADGSCCELEPWLVTLIAVMQELPSAQRTADLGSAPDAHGRES